jgi:hypothetical protein
MISEEDHRGPGSAHRAEQETRARSAIIYAIRKMDRVNHLLNDPLTQFSDDPIQRFGLGILRHYYRPVSRPRLSKLKPARCTELNNRSNPQRFYPRDLITNFCQNRLCVRAHQLRWDVSPGLLAGHLEGCISIRQRSTIRRRLGLAEQLAMGKLRIRQHVRQMQCRRSRHSGRGKTLSPIRHRIFG